MSESGLNEVKIPPRSVRYCDRIGFLQCEHSTALMMLRKGKWYAYGMDREEFEHFFQTMLGEYQRLTTQEISLAEAITQQEEFVKKQRAAEEAWRERDE